MTGTFETRPHMHCGCISQAPGSIAVLISHDCLVSTLRCVKCQAKSPLRDLSMRQRLCDQRLDAIDDVALVVTAQQVNAIPVWVAAMPVLVKLLAHPKGGHRHVMSQPE